MCFLRDEDGPTSTEYAIQLAIISSILVGHLGSLSTKASNTFNTVSNQLGKSSGS